ncbi:hypothetical protein Tco_0820449 [Tanacetum coccineum]|uniref:Uncharacterized protein n=1 Tax=Tanacetum coccineum TaxID=301880 RepID=A0ABQ5A9G3_9ASTR
MKAIASRNLGLLLLKDDSTPWFADFANYKCGGIRYQGMDFQQKNKFFKDVKNYLWDDSLLFRSVLIRSCLNTELLIDSPPRIITSSGQLRFQNVVLKWISGKGPGAKTVPLHCVRTRQYLSMGDFGTDNQEKDEKQSQNDKTGLGMEKTVKDKAKSKPESQSSQKVNRKVNWSKSKSTQVNPEAKLINVHLSAFWKLFEVTSSQELIELLSSGLEAKEPLGKGS